MTRIREEDLLHEGLSPAIDLIPRLSFPSLMPK